MNNNRGFSLIEVVIVVIIMGIVAAVAAVKYQKTMAANELEKAANNIYMELRGLRPLMFKYDERVRVKFYPTATPSKFTIEVYDSDASTPAYSLNKTYLIAPPVKIGVPTGVTMPKPYTSGWWINSGEPPDGPGAIVNGVQGEWKDSLYINANTRAQYAQGGIFLYNTRLTTTVYFVGINNAMQSIELKKWNVGAASWNNL